MGVLLKMKMNKILIVLVLFCLFAGTALAGLTPPYAVSGKVMSGDDPLDGIIIRGIVYKDRGNYEFTTTTNDDGFFLTTLDSWDTREEPYPGSQIELVVCKSGDDKCKVIKEIGVDCPSGGGCQFDFNLGEAYTVELPGDKEVEVKEVIKTKYICEDGTEVASAEDCPVVSDGWWNVNYTIAVSVLGLIALVLGIFKWGKGFKGLIEYRLKLAKNAKAKGNKAEAKKQLGIAIKMAKTVIKRAKEGKYKK